MDIINIITMEHNRVSYLESFAIVNPEDQGVIADKAEDRFAELVREARKPEIVSDEDMRIYVEDNFECNGTTIEIVWSTSENE